MNRRNLLQCLAATPLTLIPLRKEEPNDWPSHFEAVKTHWAQMLTTMGVPDEHIAEELQWLEKRRDVWRGFAEVEPPELSAKEKASILDYLEVEGILK